MMAQQTALAILVVDDEPSFTSGVAVLLRRDGHTVDTAGNGELALAQLQERRYDIVLCDLHMPDIDRPTFYDILRHQYPSLCQRVIFLTGDTLRAHSLAFLEQCGQPWLSKPCHITAIRTTIAQVRRATASESELWAAG
jgi:DNA-binding response OmpR family regulator